MYQKILFLPPLMALILVGCQSFEEKPLIPSEMLEEVEASRNQLIAVSSDPQAGQEPGVVTAPPGPGAADLMGFCRLSQWMALHGPELKRARADFDEAHAVAQIDTPFPNPELGVGIKKGVNLGPGARHKTQPGIDFGFSIPLNNRLSKQDRIHQAEEDALFVSFIVTHRKLYLQLRRLYIEWVLSEIRLKIVEEVRDSSRNSLELTRRMVEAGMASALDQGLMELEVVQQEAVQFEAKSACIQTEEALSRISGVSLDSVRAAYRDELPLVGNPLPGLEEAKEIMVQNHPGLAELRARYEVTERELCLAVALQYPDLQIGTSYEGDPGDKKKMWGLSVGIALPLFDRNQQGIAEAKARREKVRKAYAALLNESLATLEGLYERHALASDKYGLLRDTVLPRSEANLDVALRSIRSGTIDSLKYLEVERTLRSLLIEVVAAELETRQILNDIEQTIGVPLVLFPHEAEEDFPHIRTREETASHATPNGADNQMESSK